MEETPAPERPPKPTPEQVEEVERLLQQASLARIRNQNAVAERLLQEASELAPGSAAVQAAIGDELWKRGQFSKARDCYKLAHEIEPETAVYETKWAEAIVGSAGDPLALSSGLADSYASAKSAGCLSMLLPGLGQTVLGDTKRGVVMMVVYVLAWVWALLTPNGLSGFPSLLGYGDRVMVKEFNAMVLLPLFIAIATWLTAISSINVQAKRLAPKKIERPTPPGEGGFEL
jgi:hypothetical protein